MRRATELKFPDGVVLAVLRADEGRILVQVRLEIHRGGGHIFIFLSCIPFQMRMISFGATEVLIY